jgi:protein-disulfide isomerase
MATTVAAEPPRGAPFFASWKGALAAALLGAALGAGAMFALSGPIVRDYVLTHPELVPEAMQRLEADEAAKAIGANRAAIETPFAGAWAGAKDGDVALVEFFDYACPYCRHSNADVDRLLAEDKKLKVVWREWPVLGPDSEAAAQASLAAAAAGKFKPFHDALFAAGRPAPDTIAKARQAAGLPAEPVVVPKPNAPLPPELERNSRLASALKASGTPTFVVGDKILQGAVGYDILKQAIAEARARKG